MFHQLKWIVKKLGFSRIIGKSGFFIHVNNLNKHLRNINEQSMSALYLFSRLIGVNKHKANIKQVGLLTSFSLQT